MKKRIKVRQPLNKNSVDINYGLNDSQINERQLKGYVNNVKIGSSKSYFSIIIGNMFSFFNILCFCIFLWLITVTEDINGAKNLTFMVIITANILIGIIQEIKAKLTMDKLSLLSSPNIRVRRNGEESEIKLNSILLGDIMLLEAGAQVCSDCIIKEGEVEVNESLLTGESLPIKKSVGDELLSGSFIVTGKCCTEVNHIAEENYIQKLAIDAKKFKKADSELLHSLKIIMRIIGILIFPIAIISFLTNWNEALNEIVFQSEKLFGALFHLNAYSSSQLYQAYKTAVTPTSTAMIGMIPAGLFLLTSIALAVGVIRLAKQKALVQELYSIETLARVDMLCLDKTGTITDGTMIVKEVIPLNADINDVHKIISSMQFALEGNNQTSNALTDFFGAEELIKAEFTIPFSSERKCSAVKLEGDALYVLGAPEYTTNNLSDELGCQLNDYAKNGYRCLLLAKNISDNYEKDVLPQDNAPLAIIVIQDNIKSDAIEIIQYFKDNDVDVRVISGDNPVTVSEVARRVGIKNADKYLSLQDMSDEEISEVALDYTVFGRVSPGQKKLLVQLFKKAGNTVAMTGDGINDILALKEADCSVAMANGSEATRNVAQIVLLDSNFASMPKVVGEGRRVVNNIERASTLFLTKTLFSMILQLMLVLLGRSLPLEPIQLSFISFFAIGIPSFFLALEPNNKRIDGKFMVNVGKRVLPGAIAVAVNIMFIMIFTGDNGIIPMDGGLLNTTVMISTFLVFMQILFNICRPYNTNRIILLGVLSLWSILCIFLMPYGKDTIWNLFNIVHINNATAIFMIMALFLVSQYIYKACNAIADRIKMDKHNRIYFDMDYEKVRKFFKKSNKK